MEDSRREILNQVAQGVLTPEEAAARLDELGRGPTATAVGAITKVRVVTNFGITEVLGDAAVQEAVADGPHVARREGDTLVIESDDVQEGLTGFYFGRSAGAASVFMGYGQRPPKLLVRMNPQLALSLSCAAGKVSVTGVKGPVRAEVAAGSVVINGFSGPIDISTMTGSVSASGVLDHGESRVRCETGKVAIHLARGSDVRVAGRATLGRVGLPGERTAGRLIDGGRREVTVGSGKATLEVEANVGKVEVTAEDESR
jgi:hypothetical protein